MAKPRAVKAAWLPVLAAMLLTLPANAAAEAADGVCESGGDLSSPACRPGAPHVTAGSGESASAPDLHVQDGFLSDDLREELIQVRLSRRAGECARVAAWQREVLERRQGGTVLAQPNECCLA